MLRLEQKTFLFSFKLFFTIQKKAYCRSQSKIYMLVLAKYNGYYELILSI